MPCQPHGAYCSSLVLGVCSRVVHVTQTTAASVICSGQPPCPRCWFVSQPSEAGLHIVPEGAFGPPPFSHTSHLAYGVARFGLVIVQLPWSSTPWLLKGAMCSSGSFISSPLQMASVSFVADRPPGQCRLLPVLSGCFFIGTPNQRPTKDAALTGRMWTHVLGYPKSRQRPTASIAYDLSVQLWLTSSQLSPPTWTQQPLPC